MYIFAYTERKDTMCKITADYLINNRKQNGDDKRTYRRESYPKEKVTDQDKTEVDNA